LFVTFELVAAAETHATEDSAEACLATTVQDAQKQDNTTDDAANKKAHDRGDSLGKCGHGGAIVILISGAGNKSTGAIKGQHRWAGEWCDGRACAHAVGPRANRDTRVARHGVQLEVIVEEGGLLTLLAPYVKEDGSPCVRVLSGAILLTVVEHHVEATQRLGASARTRTAAATGNRCNLVDPARNRGNAIC